MTGRARSSAATETVGRSLLASLMALADIDQEDRNASNWASEISNTSNSSRGSPVISLASAMAHGMLHPTATALASQSPLRQAL